MLQLVDEITGDQFRPSGDGLLLIGNDKHCQCRYADLPKIAAAVVGFDGRDWILYDVKSTSLSVNGQLVSSVCALCDGDLIQVADLRLRAVGLGPVVRGRTDHLNVTAAFAACSGGDGAAQSQELQHVTLIGTAQVCSIVFSPQSRLKTRHCLLVPYSFRWYAVNLTSGFAQDGAGRKWQGVAEIQDRDAIQIGHLRIRFEIPNLIDQGETQSGVQDGDTDPVRSHVKSLGEISGGAKSVPSEVADSNREALALDRSAVDGEKNPGAVSDRGPVGRESLFPVDADLAAVAQDVFNTAKARQLTISQPVGKLHPIANALQLAAELSLVEVSFMEGRRLHSMERMKSLLRDSPWDRSLLMTFARMCDVSGLHDLCLHTLHLLHRQFPDDVVILKSLARISLLLAKHEPRYFTLCIRYWKRVQTLCPSEHQAIQTTIRNVSTEQAIAYQFFDRK